MLTLTIKIIEKPEGIFFTYDPCDQTHSTAFETTVAHLMFEAIQAAMTSAAKNLKCPLKLYSIDDPRDKP